jgi:hypothetical protein
MIRKLFSRQSGHCRLDTINSSPRTLLLAVGPGICDNSARLPRSLTTSRACEVADDGW